MKFIRRLALAAALLPLVATPVTAQRWTWDLGVNGGYSWFTKALDSEDTGLAEDVPGSSVRFEPGWLVGGQLGYWWGSNFGTRLNFRYADRDIEGNDDVQLFDHVNLWGGTFDLMFRLSAPRSEYTGMEFLPYIAAGAGLRWYNPSGDDFVCQSAEDTQFCGPFTTGPVSFALDEDASFTGLVGLGADWRIARNWSIRTEINDMIFKPEIKLVDPTANPLVFDIINEEGVSKTVHEIGAQIGVHMLFGVPRPQVVAVTPAPPPPAAPPPPPPPTEEMVTVCVIDPTTTGGIRTESAVFVPSTGDTLITVNGQRVPLRTATSGVIVASNASWYVSGAPLVMNIGSERVELATTGTPRMVTATDLAFLGTINGLPVYADADEVQDVREELAELNRAQRGTDLGKLLSEHKDIREDLADVKVFYVPLQPTGCVFQALQVQEQVRKKEEQQR
jgi:hypothetical protein